MKTLSCILFALITIGFAICNKSGNTISNPINCDGLLTDTAGTNDNAKLYMPNAFSPNDDGLNDISRPLTQNISSIVLTIYDERNNVVFNTSTLGQGWRTTSGANTSVKYYYKIQVVTTSNHKIGKCGELYKLTCFPSAIARNNFYFEDQLTQSGFTGVTAESLSTCP